MEITALERISITTLSGVDTGRLAPGPTVMACHSEGLSQQGGMA